MSRLMYRSPSNISKFNFMPQRILMSRMRENDRWKFQVRWVILNFFRLKYLQRPILEGSWLPTNEPSTDEGSRTDDVWLGHWRRKWEGKQRPAGAVQKQGWKVVWNGILKLVGGRAPQCYLLSVGGWGWGEGLVNYIPRWIASDAFSILLVPILHRPIFLSTPLSRPFILTSLILRAFTR